MQVSDWVRELLDSDGAGRNKTTVVVTAGEHSREFIPVEVAIAFVESLVERFLAGDAWVRTLLGEKRVVVIPLVNPTGRSRLETSKDLCWRGMANGVDVNRNFAWGYGGLGSSADPRNEEFRGDAAYSEPETRYLKSVFEKLRPTVYLSLHSGARQLFFPYADTESKNLRRRPPNEAQLVAVARKMQAASRDFFTAVGITWEHNDYTADGTVADAAFALFSVPIVYTLEVFGEPGDLPNCFEQFNPEVSKIREVVDRLLPALDAAVGHDIIFGEVVPTAARASAGLDRAQRSVASARIELLAAAARLRGVYSQLQ